jgi:hypothetical protein
MVTFNKKLCTKRKSNVFIKLDYSMTKVYDNYSNKEFNRNYKKFQKEKIMFGNGGIPKPLYHRQQLKVLENARHLQ